MQSALPLNAPQLPTAPRVERLDILRLIRSRRVGATTFHRLIAEHGDPASALAALPEIARAAGITDYRPCPASLASAELAAGHRASAKLLTCFDPDYPDALREVSDAPPVLWVRGNLAALGRPKIAVIGARNASSLGLRMARAIASGLGRAGICTVSGLARGIDTTAHEASAATGTIAVMAGGIDMIYPSENAALAESLCENGILLSEVPPGIAPVARHFPARNRIISALSQAVVVVEAAERSGSLLTARNALDQGREVLAVPGHPMDARAAGCNNLIRDGATLVRSAADILTALSLEPAPVPISAAIAAPITSPTAAQPQPLSTASQDKLRQSDIRARILARLNFSPTEENCLIRDLGASPAEVAPELLALELSGDLARMPGGMVMRVS